MKLDRLLGILTTLLQNERVTAPYLAEKFEVTRRTIGRDIDALCMAGIPVVTRQGAGGGISIAQGYKLDKSVLTEPELTQLVAALKGIGSVSERSAIERTLDKLAPGGVVSMRDSIIIDLAGPYQKSLTHKIGLIKRAIAERLLIEFTYHAEKGRGVRRIEPCFVAFEWGAWYVFGYCLERQDWRLFKLTRLWELKLLELRFAPRDVPPGRANLSARLTDEHRMVALFDPSVEYLVVDSYGPDCFTREPDGRLRLEVPYTNRDYIRGWLLGFGDKVEALLPPGLRAELRQISQNMLRLYEPDR